jgi:drug/metabolite transporter (DMT)-like permease
MSDSVRPTATADRSARRSARGADGLGTGAALGYVFLWSSAYVPSKIGVLDSSPLWFLVTRFAVAGLLAFAIARRAHAPLPQTRADWLAVIALGLLGNALYLGFTYEALRHLASGVGAIIASLNPLVLALLAPALLGERLAPLKLAGLLLGFGGVVLIMLARAGSGTATPSDVGLAFAGVIASVLSTIVFKKYFAGRPVQMTTALQLLCASAFLVVPAFAFEGFPHAHWSPRLAISFAYLVLVMSVGASLLWFWLLERGEASRVSAFYFLTPIFGLGIAFVVLGEPVGLRDLGGLVAIAAGITLVQRA